MSSTHEWIKTATGARYVHKDTLATPAASTPGIVVGKGVAHVAHSLPNGFDEGGQPLIRGAGSYLRDGTPVIHDQGDIDRIQRNHPEFQHDKNKHRLNLDK